MARAGVIVAILLISASVGRAQGGDLRVPTVQVQPREVPALLDVTYDLETVDGQAVTVSLFLSTDTGTSFPHLCYATSGDIGNSVLPGVSRHILWDAGAESPGFSGATFHSWVTAIAVVHTETQTLSLLPPTRTTPSLAMLRTWPHAPTTASPSA